MLAVDTNIVVRILTQDDPTQTTQARRLLAANQTFVADSVLLETEWVLRSLYRLAALDVVAGLRRFIGLDGVTLDNPARVAAALDSAEAGFDFADALHLAHAAHCEAFVTFDKSLVRAARGVSPLPVRAP